MNPTTLREGYLMEQDGRVQVDAILDEVARAFNLDVDDVIGDSREQRIIRARKTAMAVMRELTDLSLPAIGRVFGKDHTTVMHHIESVKNDPRRQRAVALVISQLTAKEEAS